MRYFFHLDYTFPDFFIRSLRPDLADIQAYLCLPGDSVGLLGFQ